MENPWWVRAPETSPCHEQEAQIVAENTASLERVLGKRPEHTHTVIDELDPENWGFGGVLTTCVPEGTRLWLSEARRTPSSRVCEG
jgi:4-oxalocrotonate tautomerase